MPRATHVPRISAIIALALAFGPLLPDEGRATHPSYSCNTCHVAHDSSSDLDVPLWNPALAGTTLVNDYQSPTLDAELQPFDGTSRLCLSCHDGSSPDIVAGSASHLTSAAQSHPVSFVYDSALAMKDGELRDPGELEVGVLDANSRMQCSSCHDVHANPVEPNKSLRWAWAGRTADPAGMRTNTQFCRTCHIK